MTALVELRNLRIRRDRRIVLEIDALDIQLRERLAVMGPNGSGKSTLLLALASLLKAEQGTFFFAGKPVHPHKNLAYRRRIGLVTQDALLLNRSVLDNAALGLRYRGIPSQVASRQVDEWLERLGILHLRTRSALELSGGEARRVALVRAFVLHPELLLLDEPFAALDRTTRTRLQADLKEILGGLNITTVFSTHSETDVQKLALRKITLENGRLVGD